MDEDKIEIRVEDAEASKMAELEAKLAEAEAAAAQYREELLRRAADLENTRKRLLRDHERACAAAARRIVEQLLPLAEDINRAWERAAEDPAVPGPHAEALRLLAEKLGAILAAEGVEVVRVAPGDIFDPEIHEAVSVTCDPALPPGTVVGVLAPGYKFQGTLLKPARVQVCAPAAADGIEPDLNKNASE